MHTIILYLSLLLVACGGAAGEYSDGTPDGGTVPDAGGPSEPRIPLCPGEYPPEPTDCQTLVYDLRTGYCNAWSPCSELGQ